MFESSVIRILVVDDHQVVRQGFAIFIQAVPDLLLVGEAGNGEEAVQKYEELKPDVILMDLVMPVMNGIEAIRILHQRHPAIKIIALTGFTDNQQLMQLALDVGATSYLFKDISILELANAIRLTHRGLPVFSPQATRLLVNLQPEPPAKNFNLSDREREVLHLVVQGLNNREIAEKLGVSRSTIKFHVSSILRKLGAGSRTEAVSIAHQHRLIT